MKTFQLLDCTLREGGYLTNKRFGYERIKKIIAGLLSSNIDIIEMGFLQNEGAETGKTIFCNASEASQFLVGDKHNAQFCVLADYGRYSINRLEPNEGMSFDIVRECFLKKDRINVIKDCSEIVAKGYKLSVQPVDILDYSKEELVETLLLINKLQPYSFSIVDTFGSMYEEDLERVYGIVNSYLNSNCKIGFHSHNNLQLSNSLAQSLIRLSNCRREIIVDATLRGMGRGAGIASTELLALYLNTKYGGEYNVEKLLEMIETDIESCLDDTCYGYSMLNFLAGKYGAHVNTLAYLADKNLSYNDIDQILSRLSRSGLKRYVYSEVENEYKSFVAHQGFQQ